MSYLTVIVAILVIVIVFFIPLVDLDVYKAM